MKVYHKLRDCDEHSQDDEGMVTQGCSLTEADDLTQGSAKRNMNRIPSCPFLGISSQLTLS